MLDTHCSIIFAGVGGQGVLSLAQLTLEAARRDGFEILQSEIHGMSQRGGMVNSHVQFAKEKIFSPIISQGTADLILATEPLEALRYVSFLRKQGIVLTSKSALKNFAQYPDFEKVLARYEQLPCRLVDTDLLLQKIGFKQGLGTVLLGIASRQLPIQTENWLSVFKEFFAAKGQAIVDKNLAAFELGRSL